MLRFGLIGDGIIAQRHKEAIKHVGGELVWISDPKYPKANSAPAGSLITDKRICDYSFAKEFPNPWMLDRVDYVVICSPTYLHREHVQGVLKNSSAKIICEKPLCLPWEPLIDDDRINIVLQLRWIKDLPKKAKLIRAVMVRNEEFFKSWKGDPRKAGGNIYEFFIHYIDLAIQLGAGFEGQALSEGKQIREIIWTEYKEEREEFVSRFEVEARNMPHPHSAYSREVYNNGEQGWIVRKPAGEYKQDLDIMKIDMQDCYNRMYEDILRGNGVKPKDIFYLTWVLNRFSDICGYRYAGIHDKVEIRADWLK